MTTTQANELIFATGYGNSGGTLTSDPNYTMEQYNTWQGTQLAVEDRSVTSTRTYTQHFRIPRHGLGKRRSQLSKLQLSGAATCGIHGDATGHMPTDWAAFTPPAEGDSYTDSTFGYTLARRHGTTCYLGMGHDYSTLFPGHEPDFEVKVGLTDPHASVHSKSLREEPNPF